MSSIGSTVFKNVCLGGTFDGIHAGHKLLFNEATSICTGRLVVGVTDSDMIKGKILWELIAPVEERIEKVRDYLVQVKPNLTYNVVAINDVYGPTITDQDLECIVVSRETVRGATKINEKRRELGWTDLKVHITDLVKDGETPSMLMKRLGEDKISSSCMRINKLGRILRPPAPNTSLPDRPYLIGLTGGIASGKTSIGKYLETLGFGYVNYDLLGHKTYEQPGSVIYNKIVEQFKDHSIIDEETKKIDRGKLGKIVFNDKSKLEKLNEIVWPGIYELVDKEIERLKSDHDVIVLESALLLESGQNKRVHQVWTAIIDQEEAIQRQKESRGLSREDAERRIKAQTDNLTRVRQSNAVFCSKWEPEFTQQQVRRCVEELKEKYLK